MGWQGALAGTNANKGGGAHEKEEVSVGEEKHARPRREASDPQRPPAPGDEVPPGTQGAAEDVCPQCGGSGRLDNGESCPNCNGTGVIIRAVGGGG